MCDTSQMLPERIAELREQATSAHRLLKGGAEVHYNEMLDEIERLAEVTRDLQIHPEPSVWPMCMTTDKKGTCATSYVLKRCWSTTGSKWWWFRDCGHRGPKAVVVPWGPDGEIHPPSNEER